MKKSFVLVAISLLIVSCSLFGPKMPNENGVYSIMNGKYTKIQMSNGRPEGRDYLNMVEVEKSPKFLFLEPNLNIDLLLLSNLNTKRNIEFSSNTKNQDIVEISINESLPSGFFCFSQGDHFAAPTQIKHWCFSIGIEKTTKSFNDGENIPLPSSELGVFILNNSSYLPMVPIDLPTDHSMQYPTDGLSIADTIFPILAVRSEQISPSDFSMYYVKPIIGISFDRFSSDDNGVIINSVNENCNAYDAGILGGDRIVSVNDIKLNTQDEVIDKIKSDLEYGGSIDLQISRNALIYDVVVMSNCVILEENDSYTSEIKNDYYIFYPTTPLTPGGIYCFSDNRMKGYCFLVSPES